MSAPTPDTMTRGERAELTSLLKKQERVLKSAATQRAAELLAEFEEQISAVYSFDDDETWKEARVIAVQAVAEANKIIAERCEALGIHPEFAPSIESHWYARGSNAVAARRTELRKLAKAQVEAAERTAKTRIEQHSLTAQTQLVSLGLASDAAKLFLENMPTVETLMPRLDVVTIKGLLK